MKREEGGFTLVEVLIAVALLGMLTVLAYGTVRLGTMAWTHTTERRDLAAEHDAIVRLLRQAIRSAYPSFTSLDYADRRITFKGEPERIDLVTPLPDAIEPGVMARETFSLEAVGAQQGLFMTWALDLPASGERALSLHRVRLAADVSAVRFAFFGSTESGRSAVWTDRWTGMVSLPELVRVQAWHSGDTSRPWLDLTVETKTTTNTDCVYVAEEPTCRRLE